MGRYTNSTRVEEAEDISGVSASWVTEAIDIAEALIDQETGTSWTHVQQTISLVGDGSTIVVPDILYIQSVDTVTVDSVDVTASVVVRDGGQLYLSSGWTTDKDVSITITAGATSSAPDDIVQAATIEAQVRVRDRLRQGGPYHSFAQVNNEHGQVIPMRPGGKYGFSSSPVVNAIVKNRCQRKGMAY